MRVCLKHKPAYILIHLRFVHMLSKWISRKNNILFNILFPQMSHLPGYKLRIECLLFKASFDEKVEEISKMLKMTEQAAVELRASQKLTKVLEVSR